MDHCYTLRIDEWRDDWDSLRGIFDSGEDFLKYCKKHLEKHIYLQNLEFDRNKCMKREEAINFKEEVLRIKQQGNCRILSDMQEGIIIFGTGFYGKEMTEILHLHNIPIIAYVDNDENKWNTTQNGIPVLNPKKLKDVKGIILVAVYKDEDAIIEQLKELNNNELKWIGLRELIFKMK